VTRKALPKKILGISYRRTVTENYDYPESFARVGTNLLASMGHGPSNGPSTRSTRRTSGRALHEGEKAEFWEPGSSGGRQGWENTKKRTVDIAKSRFTCDSSRWPSCYEVPRKGHPEWIATRQAYIEVRGDRTCQRKVWKGDVDRTRSRAKALNKMGFAGIGSTCIHPKSPKAPSFRRGAAENAGGTPTEITKSAESTEGLERSDIDVQARSFACFGLWGHSMGPISKPRISSSKTTRPWRGPGRNARDSGPRPSLMPTLCGRINSEATFGITGRFFGVLKFGEVKGNGGRKTGWHDVEVAWRFSTANPCRFPKNPWPRGMQSGGNAAKPQSR